jgi:thiamine transporter
MFLNSLLSDAVWYPVQFDTFHNAARSVAIWLTLAAIVAFVILAFTVKKEKRQFFYKVSLISAIAYACVVGLFFLVLNFVEDGLNLILFIPLLILILVVAASAIVIALKRNKVIYIVAGVASLLALVATLVCMEVYFASGEAAENNWLTNADVNTVGLYISVVLFIAALVAAAFLLDKNTKNGFDSKSISYAAICVAMSFALSYLRIVKMPQGGSITIASLLPLMIYSYMFGTKKGVFAGMVYGFMQAIQDFYILHPAQFLLDYPVAFACIGLAGMFASVKALDKYPQLQFALGAIVAGVCRFAAHFLSGIFAFGAFAPEGTPVVLYSLSYQAAYVFPDLAIAIVAGIFVFSSRSFVKVARSYRTLG